MSLLPFQFLLSIRIQLVSLRIDGFFDESLRHLKLLSCVADINRSLYLVGNDGDTLRNIMYETLFGIRFALLGSDCVCCLIGDKVNLIVLQILMLCGCRELPGKAVWVVAIWQ